jgi:hypothetical protein
LRTPPNLPELYRAFAKRPQFENAGKDNLKSEIPVVG